MKISVTKEMFVEAFKQANRENQFSQKAKEAIYDYLLLCEEEIQSERELDVVEVCCTFTEVLKKDEDELKKYSQCMPAIVLKKSLIFN